MQLSPAADLHAVWPSQVFHAQRHVHAQLSRQAVFDLAKGDSAPVVAGERTVVHKEEHSHSGFFYLERRQGHGARVRASTADNVSPMVTSAGPASQTMSPAATSSTARF